MKNTKVHFQPFNHLCNRLYFSLNRLNVTIYSVTFNRIQPLSTRVKIYVLSTFFLMIYI